MTTYRHREETLNTQLAILLARFGVRADAETIQASGRERPDILFNWRGLRVVIEGKFADHPQAREVMLGDAYDALCDRELQALARLNHDPARCAIDQALSAALGLPDLGPLREMLAREPGLAGKAAVGRPAGQQQ